MKPPNIFRSIMVCLIAVLLNGSLCSQEKVQQQIDSIQTIIDKTKAQDSIRNLLSQQLLLAEELDNLRLQAEIEMKLGNASSYEGFDKEQHNLKALSIYKTLNDTLGIIESYYQLSAAKQYQNDYDSTKIYADKMLLLAEAKSETVSIIKGRLMLSSVYNHLSQYAKSLEELNKARILAETSADESVLIDVLNKETFIYYSLEQYDKSASKIKRIIELFKKRDDPRSLNLWMNNLASVYSLCDNCATYQERKDILKESIKYSDIANFAYGKAFAYKHLADVYRNQGIQDSSIYYLNRIERLLPEINKKDFTALVSIAQGAYWGNEGNNDRAIFYFQKAHDIWKEIGRMKEQMDMAWNLGTRYAEKGDFRKAYKYAQTYIGLKDTIYNADNIRKIKELELNYDFRQTQITDSLKNEEKINLLKVTFDYKAAIQRRSQYILIIVALSILVIAILIYTNFKKQKKLASQLEIKSAQVENELNQKKLLLTEIHHRVKNNFQILSSLLELQAKGSEDPATRNLISEGKNRVKSMALIHNQLYNTNSLKLKLEDYLKKLVSEVQKSFQGKESDVKYDIDSSYEVDVDTMVPLGLIANELITNTYKYVDETQIELSITLKNEEGFEVLEFKDNGPGLPKDFNPRNAKSTGIWLVSRLALQLHGRYEYVFKEGSVFRILFKQSGYQDI